MTVRTVLIVSTRRSLQEGLEALLASLPEIRILARVRSAEQAVGILENLSPDLLLLDVEGLGEESHQLLAMLQNNHPKSKSLVLVESLRQQTQVQVVGADVALIKGYPADELIETVKALLALGNTK
jgi:DNA-binding NarL/FixJ family response regulator